MSKEAGSARQEVLEIVVAELERSLEAMESNYRRAVSNLNMLKERVEMDDLTRLLRRGVFMEKLHNLLFQSAPKGREVCLMMIDIDHFKRVNDGYGHQTGDVVLERVSELIKSYLRPEDLVGRYGGEEIIVAMQMSASEANSVANRIRRAVEAHRMISTNHAEFRVTLSVGVASTQEFKYEADVLISHADKALYRAKKLGRNRVVNAKDSLKVMLSLERAAA
ncbi:MAG: GGDEF domain-containing protein [Bdellovibrionota bacterium]